MSAEGIHDDLLLNVLKEEGQLLPFLDTVFGFLYRRTDFYITQEDPSAKLGFPPGIAEQVVRDTFRKWQKRASTIMQGNEVPSVTGDMSDLVIQEEEVITTDSCDDGQVELSSGSPTVQQPFPKEFDREEDLTSDTFNGADCGNYRWSQTGFEVDIKIPVPSNVFKSNEVRVDIQACRLSVCVRDGTAEWRTLVDGQLSNKHQREESIWTLSPGKHITIHLQKATEKWWDCLLTTEKKLDMSRVDMSRHVMDLPEEDQMQVERVMVEEERKRLGLPPIEHQEKLDVLKKSWDLKGSPFRGTPFDPSVLQLNPSSV